MLKKRILIWVVAVAVLLTGGCAVMNDGNIENEGTSPEISRIEGHLCSASEEDVVIEQSDKISEILKILNNLTEIDNYDASLLTEEISLVFYKPSVSVIKSEDTKVYSFIFYDDSNIVKMKMEVDLGLNDNISAELLGDALDVYYEISDQDKEYIEKIFE